MPRSEADTENVRVLLDDAFALTDVLPTSGDGLQLGDDLKLARILLDPSSTDEEKAAALGRARKTVHPSNQHKFQ